MKSLRCMVAAAALLISVPAMAQSNGTGGYSSIWSSAQGTSDSYGNAMGSANSQSGAMANVGGANANPSLGGASGASSVTLSTATVGSNGSGYAQVQTSGYAGGTVLGYGAGALSGISAAAVRH